MLERMVTVHFANLQAVIHAKWLNPTIRICMTKNLWEYRRTSTDLGQEITKSWMELERNQWLQSFRTHRAVSLWIHLPFLEHEAPNNWLKRFNLQQLKKKGVWVAKVARDVIKLTDRLWWDSKLSTDSMIILKRKMARRWMYCSQVTTKFKSMQVLLVLALKNVWPLSKLKPSTWLRVSTSRTLQVWIKPLALCRSKFEYLAAQSQRSKNPDLALQIMQLCRYTAATLKKDHWVPTRLLTLQRSTRLTKISSCCFTNVNTRKLSRTRLAQDLLPTQK